MLGRSDNPTAAPRLPEGEETGFVLEWPTRMRAEEKHEGCEQLMDLYEGAWLYIPGFGRPRVAATLLTGLTVASGLLNAVAMTS